MKKLIAILIFAFAVHGVAQAQFSGLLNKAKETIKKEAKEATGKSTDNATQGVTKATLDEKTSVSTAGLSDEVYQAVAKLKDSSLRPPTCWAYDAFAD